MVAASFIAYIGPFNASSARCWRHVDADDLRGAQHPVSEGSTRSRC